jgi:hypothetical protein
MEESVSTTRRWPVLVGGAGDGQPVWPPHDLAVYAHEAPQTIDISDPEFARGESTERERTFYRLEKMANKDSPVVLLVWVVEGPGQVELASDRVWRTMIEAALAHLDSPGTMVPPVDAPDT